MKFNNLSELKKVGKLEYGDILMFGDLEYKVNESFLSNKNGYNSDIFDLGDKDKMKFCTEAYGYEAIDHLFPQCKPNDYEALYHVAVKIYTEILQQLGEFTRGDLVDVSDNGTEWSVNPRIYLTTIEGARAPYFCVSNSLEKLYKRGEKFQPFSHKYIRKHQPVELTHEQIKEKLGHDFIYVN